MNLFRKKRLAKFALYFLVIIAVASILAPLFTQDPYSQNVQHALATPSRTHFMGADSLGRDLCSRIIYGARISLLIGVGSAVVALLFGLVLGAFSAYVGGKTDHFLMRFVDVWYSFPALLLIVLLKEIIEQGDPKRGLWAIVIALSIYSWMHVARIVRGEVLRLKEMPFTEAARAIGASHFRIIFYHLIPNTWGPILVTLTMRIPLAILAESMLGFVGLGVKSPMASWGTLASEGWTAMRFYPHLIFFPSIVLFLTILAFNFVGEALRDQFDPKEIRP